jgi:hypothetical protein
MTNLCPPEQDERGASAVEYGLLIAGIAALIVAIGWSAATHDPTGSVRCVVDQVGSVALAGWLSSIRGAANPPTVLRQQG